MTEQNPFLITGYVSPEYFCDREKETNSIIEALQNGRDVTLISPRRMGKTGLIKHVFYTLGQQEPEIATFYIDVFSTQCLADFVKLFAERVIGSLDTTQQKVFNSLLQYLKSCRVSFSVNEFTGAPQARIEVTKNQEEATLKEIFEYLQASGKRCIIAFDEFQQIAEYPENGVEALLRSYIQFLPNVNFIFSGSKKHIMQEMFLSAKRPFYQCTQILSLDKIDRNKYYEFASQFFNNLPKEIFDDIYTRFDGHTWYMQNVLNRLYAYQSDVDDLLVIKVLSNIIEEGAYTYETLLSAYPTGCNKLLLAIAREGCVKEILSGDFILEHNLKAASSVNSSLKKLIDNELVYLSPSGYILYDRFMNLYLRTRY